MTMNMTNDDRILHLLLNAPDGTYSVTDTALIRHIFSSGYQVGLRDIPAVNDPTSIEEIRPLARVAEDYGNVSIWTDADNVRCFYISRRYIFLHTNALEIAKAHGERAIWDWGTMSAVLVAPKPEPEEADLATWVEQTEDGHPNGTRIYRCMTDRARDALRGFDPDPDNPDVFDFSGPEPVEPRLLDGLTVRDEGRR